MEFIKLEVYFVRTVAETIHPLFPKQTLLATLLGTSARTSTLFREFYLRAGCSVHNHQSS